MRLLNVLFWNVCRKDLTPQLVNLAVSKQIDILILAENPVDSSQIVAALNQRSTGYHANHPLSQCEKITIISQFPHEYIALVDEDNRVTIRRVTIPGIAPFLLTALHLPDKRNMSGESQGQNASSVSDFLLEGERRAGLGRHLVIGDFNMNPFEVGMVKANGFHGTMSSRIAMQGSRTVQGRKYPYFYNPTWGLFGDLNKEASGTYYYNRAEHVCYQWNLFDQVLIRPGMINNFVKDSLEIIESDGATSLLTEHKLPFKSQFSDHLPLFFTLRF